jgi:transcriptional regulator with XRE-family HTH domain
MRKRNRKVAAAANAAWLRELMEQRGYTRDEMAELLGVGRATLSAWLAPPRAASNRLMPDRMRELAELKLAQQR